MTMLEEYARKEDKNGKTKTKIVQTDDDKTSILSQWTEGRFEELINTVTVLMNILWIRYTTVTENV